VPLRCLEGISSNAPSGQSIARLSDNYNLKLVCEASCANGANEAYYADFRNIMGKISNIFVDVQRYNFGSFAHVNVALSPTYIKQKSH
jgi:hypothetical protein